MSHHESLHLNLLLSTVGTQGLFGSVGAVFALCGQRVYLIW